MSYTISGIDASKHQGVINFKTVAESGQRFAIVKATEGEGYVDKRFLENWEKLVELDGQIYRGAYAFGRPDSVGGMADGIAEAEDFCDILKAAGHYMSGAMPPCLDYEKYSGKGVKKNLAYLEGFIKTVQDRLGRSPMIYTGETIWNYQTDNSDLFKDVPLWLVAYRSYGLSGTEAPGILARMPWDELAMWQWSGGGEYAFGAPVPGCGQDGETPATVDLNWFDGTEEDLAKFCLINPNVLRQDRPLPDAGCLIKLLAHAEEELENGTNKVRQVRRALEKANVA